VTLASEVSALRSSAGLSRAEHVAAIRVDGPDALDFLQLASTQTPYAREGRVRHTLLLREDASVFADALIVKVEDSFFVLAEGPSEGEIVAWLESLKGEKNVAIHSMKDELAILSIDGPYAWEVVAGALGPVVLGMPYLTLLRKDDVLCVRAGKTGEYGYLLLAPHASADALESKLREVGVPLDLAAVTLQALDVCALESWHFSMRSIRERRLSPIELQLQWRVVYAREFVGAEALRAIRAQGKCPRATAFVSESSIAPGDRVRLGGRDVGEILAACASPTLGRTVGAALLERRFAHPHLDLGPIRTCTASLVLNKSLFVQPHRHTYATRMVEAK